MSYFLFPKITNCLTEKNFDIKLSNNVNYYSSKTLYNYLIDIKKEIDKYNILWDNYKKFTNPHEYIHTYNNDIKCSVCKLKPISRAFYKLIEICNIFSLLHYDESIKTFHLAEGPGGFMEAVNYLRNNYENDKYYGITLIDDDINVPSWRKSKSLIENKKYIIEYGPSKDGNLFKKENLEYYYNNMFNSVDLVTGDGGFDFSLDFNNQETNSLKLILVQIIYALCIQKKGGNFVLKIFDIFTLPTIQIIFILSSVYDNVYICKPNTSRIANSEKYLVCKNYKHNRNLIKYFINNFDNIFSNTKNNIYSILQIKIPYLFINKIEEYNAIYGQQQIENINFTINLINISNSKKHKKKDQLDEHKNEISDNESDVLKNENNNLEIIKKNNLQKCIQWCVKNKLPYNNI
jgi:23S rRNA U2552 (ribose-2'-O)-methylase RlmE/FtsJ